MKKLTALFDKIGRDALVGVLCLAMALLLFFSDGAVLLTVVKIIGGLITVAAVIRLIYLARASAGVTLPIITTLNAALLLALGVILACMPGGTLKFIFSAIGIYLIINALFQVLKLLTVPKAVRGALWWMDAIFTAVVLLLGAWLVLSPVGAGKITEAVAGISLAVKGTELLLGAKKSRSPKDKKNENGDIEADFVDKSHEL
jgi:uncharacterized membrane protein HdeD (DUF308 family)